jgi:hypothetical protein
LASTTRWRRAVRGSNLEEGEPGTAGVEQARRTPILESSITRRVDFALLMVEAFENDELVHEAPAIVGSQTPSARTHAASA